jgi:hypothetical protein
MILATIFVTDGFGEFLEGAAADESLESLTTDELNAKISDEQRSLLRKWFTDIEKNGADPTKIPEGLSKEAVKAYEQIAKNYIKEAPSELGVKVQTNRVKVITEALKKLK